MPYCIIAVIHKHFCVEISCVKKKKYRVSAHLGQFSLPTLLGQICGRHIQEIADQRKTILGGKMPLQLQTKYWKCIAQIVYSLQAVRNLCNLSF